MRDEHGLATLIVSGLLVVAVLLSMLIVDVARVSAARASLTAAADAAALAAAPATFADFGAGWDPHRAAAETAAANGSRLVECVCPIDRTWAARTVWVVVAGEVELALLGSRHLEAISAAEFKPVELVENP